MDIDKWADRIYLEDDFGKNIATTIAGVIGLAIYLYKSDFALAAFVAIILFPTIKILVNVIKERSLKKQEILNKENRVKELDSTFKLDVQVFDDRLGKRSQQEQYLADREGVGSNLPKILPLICFADGISWKTSLIVWPISLSFSPGFSCFTRN